MKKSKSPNEWIVVNQKCNNLVKELRREVLEKKQQWRVKRVAFFLAF